MKLFYKRVIGDENNPLMFRYIIFRTKWIGFFVHKFLRDDHDRALHDHPWSFISIILKGGYYEVTEEKISWKGPGSILYRPAAWRHRVVLLDGIPSWSFIIRLKRTRDWGFWPDGKWCLWRKYNWILGICEENEIHEEPHYE
jgi:hypothetical protein